MSSRALSIIIPAYNEGARIDATLDRVMTCVETQGWDAEVLAVDDGSQDDTASIVERWMAADPRIRLLKEPPKSRQGIFRSLRGTAGRGRDRVVYRCRPLRSLD